MMLSPLKRIVTLNYTNWISCKIEIIIDHIFVFITHIKKSTYDVHHRTYIIQATNDRKLLFHWLLNTPQFNILFALTSLISYFELCMYVHIYSISHPPHNIHHTHATYFYILLLHLSYSISIKCSIL